MKKKKLFRLILLVSPLLLLFIHLNFMLTFNANHKAIFIDPDYTYLVSSIDISKLEKSKLVIHPGTTVQMLSHLIMRCAYRFAGNTGDDFQTSVLKNPGFYLDALNSTFASFNIILVLLVGIITYNITKNYLASLLIQFTPFLSPQIIIWGLKKLSTEILLISITLIMCLILVKVVHTDTWGDRKKIYLYAIILGLVSGFGIATKLTFILLCIIPIILMPLFIHRFVYILSTIFSGFIFTLPIASTYFRMYNFLKKIFTHTGLYGRGRESIIDVDEYISNLYQIVKENLPFIVILLISIILIIVTLVSSESRKKAVKNLEFKLLFSITIVQVCTIGVVAKHFKSRYLLPVLCLSGLMVYLIYLHFKRIYQNKTSSQSLTKKHFKWVYAMGIFFFIFSFVNTLVGVSKDYRELHFKSKEAIEIRKKIKNELKDYCRVYYYTAPSIIFGLEFGNRWTPGYTGALRKLYGDRYFFNHRKHFFYNWNRSTKVSLEDLKAKHNNRIILVGFPFHRFGKHIQKPGLPLRDVLGGKYLTIYKVGGE